MALRVNIRKKIIGRVLWALVVALMGLFYYFSLPDPLFDAPYSTVLEDRQGRLLGAVIAKDGQWRFPHPEKVPPKFRQAILTFEDEYFYGHPGFNPFSIARAAWQNLTAGEIVSGGSTLSMQTIRMSRRGQARNIPEKIIELILATRLELRYSKDEILALYAAHAPFGGNIVGLEAAAWRYYGRRPDQLSWGESATLAVLPNSPSLVYPGRNSDQLLSKRNRLLQKLRSKGLLDSLTCALACLEPLPDQPKALPKAAPHLLSRMITEGQQGKRVRSSLRAGLQASVQERVQRHYEKLRGNGVHNAAALVLDVASGEALAYVGNTRPNDPRQHAARVDIIRSVRSTGSILKPILYAAMLHEGSLLPQSLLPDVPTYIDGFAPENFDKKYSGAVPADEALASSLNVPAVHMLRQFGVEKFHHLLRQMGMRSLDKAPGHYGLSLILGGAEATPWEIGGMYAAMARSMRQYFTYAEPRRYSRSDYHLPLFVPAARQDARQDARQEEGLLGAASLWFTFEAMAKVRRPENEAGWEYFDSSRKLAWKTGTSFGFRDAWAVGLTPDYVIVVWTGNADGEGRAGHTGLSAAAPLLFDIAGLMPETDWFDYPGSDMSAVPVSRQSGFRAGRHCDDAVVMDVPMRGTKSPLCQFHRLIRLDASGRYRVHSACEPLSRTQTARWFVLPPLQASYYKLGNPSYRPLPAFRSDCMPAYEGAVLQLVYPRADARVYIPRELDGKKGRTVLEAAHRDPQSRVFWHLDEKYLGETVGVHQMAVNPEPGRHRLTLLDEQGNQLEHNFTVLQRTD